MIQGLILLSLLAFSLDTLPNLSPTYRTYLRIFEIISVAIFTVEYLARFIVASPKSSFVFSFLGLVDLMAILPFYLSLGIDLRSLRVFRLMRLFRLLKLARYSAAVQRFHRALLIAKEELVLFLFVAGSLIFVTAVGIYYFENQAQPEAFASVFHALWWSIVTLTTVGYGDVYPVTTGGKVFTFLMLLVGLGVVSVPAGIVATALSQARDVEQQEQTESAQ
ncbi:MAG: ion transporter [Planctomycetota bacterium]